MDPRSSFHIAVHRDGQTVMVVPGGELDLASAPELEAELERAFHSAAKLVIVDLRDLDFMDSTGLRVIITAQQRAHECDRRFGVVDGRAQIHKLLMLAGVLDRLHLVTAPQLLRT